MVYVMYTELMSYEVHVVSSTPRMYGKSVVVMQNNLA